MNDVNKQFARQPRQEALRATPAFSEALHARIMRAVEAADSRGAEAEGGALPRRRGLLVIGARHPGRLALAIAACMALVFSPLGVRLRQTQTSREVIGPIKHSDPVVVVKADPFKTAREVNLRVKGVVETAMAEQQWAGLDQDVRLATRYLSDRVPFRAAWENNGRDH